jgi:hypothetical protein
MITFDGASNRILTDFRINSGTDITISAMIYSKGNASHWNSIFGNGSIFLSVLNGDSICFYSYLYGVICVTETNSILSNNWYHITCTLKYGVTNIVNIFINGVLSVSGYYHGTEMMFNFSIGDIGYSSPGSGCFYGYIPSVSVYNKILSDDEITQNYLKYKTKYNLT